MGKNSFQIIEHQTATHSELFGYERIYSGKFEGKIFYFWNDQSEAKCNIDFSQFNNFYVSRPIIHSATFHYNQNFTKPTNQPFVDLYRMQFESSGYAKPYFSFVRNQFDMGLFTTEAYESVLNQFHLGTEELIPPEKFNSIALFRDQLLKQVERQSEVVFRINQLIALILKVYAYGLHEHKKSNPAGVEGLNVKLAKFFNHEILGGSSSKQFDLNWMISLESEGIPKELFNSSLIGCSHLLEVRDCYLKVAMNILENLYPIELCLESTIVNGRLLSPREFREKLMISPQLVASEMLANAKSSKYSTDTISSAMTVVKDYLIENELYSIKGQVSLLERRIRDKNIPGVTSDTDDKTIRNWVEKYADQAQIFNK